MRTLNSKKQRKHLWYASDGKCQICNKPLGDDWEADHKIPWSTKQETNVHDMQATCKTCNRRKGKSMWRLHQEEMLDICNEILATREITDVLASVTPGGGKSALPVILANKLIPIVADKICWIVPRDNLRSQGERTFTDKIFLKLLGSDNRKLIRSTQNEYNPSRGTRGYITTYQSISSDPDLHRQEFERHRYILFLDEPHHVERGGVWHKALQPLVDKATLRVYASGTLERGDKRRIAFIPYKNVDGIEIVDTSNSATKKTILYDRSSALRDVAILPLHFEVLDGRAEWLDKNGKFQSVNSFNENGNDSKAALHTALRTDYAYSLLDKCITQWLSHKKEVYSQAKLLVVSPDIFQAKKYQAFLTDSLRLSNVEIATSDEPKLAKQAIRRFRTLSNSNILITVGMAYEGLDIPEIAFTACLTNYRTKPWLEQCFARANRKAKNKQYGVIWAPNDKEFREIIEEIKKEQINALQIEFDLEDKDVCEIGGSGKERRIVSLASEATFRLALDMASGKDLDKDTTSILNLAALEAKINGLSTIQLDAFLSSALEKGYGNNSINDNENSFSSPILTITALEKSLKREINAIVQRYCDKNKIKQYIPNGDIKRVFGKPRKDMSAEELKQVLSYAQERYQV